MDLPGQPILTCDEARRFEAAYFGGDETREWAAMREAGRLVAESILEDFRERGGMPRGARVLVLAGKGHNGGDAMIAAERLLAARPGCRVDLGCPHGPAAFKPLASRAWRELIHAGGAAVEAVTLGRLAHRYDLVLDGLYGFQFRPPLDERSRAWLRAVNALPVGLRAAVDLPSGLADPDAFRADFSYGTGLLKSPVLDLAGAGRLRWLDLGFDAAATFPTCADWVLDPRVLDPLRALRPAAVDKRAMGHVVLVGGSRQYPGAILMSVLAALRSGVGLVTAMVPESLVPAFAARAPEAMWVGWPETPEGGLALEGVHLFAALRDRATAVLVGPGTGKEAETRAALGEVVRTSTCPLVIDADALVPEVVGAGAAPRVLTPHAGEFARISQGKALRACAADLRAAIVLKGPVTRVTDGGRVYHSLAGGPVLARGGSGDVLAGLLAGRLAQRPAIPLVAACQAVAWHGRAADLLARARGQTAVSVTALLDFLPAALGFTAGERSGSSDEALP